MPKNIVVKSVAFPKRFANETAPKTSWWADATPEDFAVRADQRAVERGWRTQTKDERERKAREDARTHDGSSGG